MKKFFVSPEKLTFGSYTVFGAKVTKHCFHGEIIKKSKYSSYMFHWSLEPDMGRKNSSR